VKIAFVAPRFPYPPTKGDKLRVYQAIKHLSRDHQIVLVAATDEPVREADVAEVARFCSRVEIVPVGRLQSFASLAFRAPFSSLPLQTHFYDSAAMRRRLATVLAEETVDVIHASLIRILPYVWDVRDVPVVVDLMDTFSRSIALRKRTASPLTRWAYEIEERRVAAYERAACERFPLLFVCAEIDRQALHARNVSVIRTCADLDAFEYRREGREDDLVIMTGNMGYPPNVDAVTWFVANVWPLVRAARPQLRFRVVGLRPARQIRELAGSHGIEVTGPVRDVAAELQRATLAVCPMRVGSGMQIKVLEAMATGTPIVSTSFGNEGIEAVPGAEIEVADEPQAFASAMLGLLSDPVRRARIAAAARRSSETNFTWSAHAALLEKTYRRAIAFHS
jgi:sugar transferase (PEP-CTERM/EpsH1 system associated)